MLKMLLIICGRRRVTRAAPAAPRQPQVWSLTTHIVDIKSWSRLCGKDRSKCFRTSSSVASRSLLSKSSSVQYPPCPRELLTNQQNELRLEPERGARYPVCIDLGFIENWISIAQVDVLILATRNTKSWARPYASTGTVSLSISHNWSCFWLEYKMIF